MQLINIARALPDVGRTEASMTDRDKAYLVAHNKRRMEWHAYYEKQYVPLKWSRGKFIVTRMPHPMQSDSVCSFCSSFNMNRLEREFQGVRRQAS